MAKILLQGFKHLNLGGLGFQTSTNFPEMFNESKHLGLKVTAWEDLLLCVLSKQYKMINNKNKLGELILE